MACACGKDDAWHDGLMGEIKPNDGYPLIEATLDLEMIRRLGGLDLTQMARLAAKDLEPWFEALFSYAQKNGVPLSGIVDCRLIICHDIRSWIPG